MTTGLCMLPFDGILKRRRSHSQNEINFLVQDFSDFALSQEAYAFKVTFHLLTVNRWVESCLGKSATDVPTSTLLAAHFVVLQSRSSRSAPDVANPDWPNIVVTSSYKLWDPS